MPNENHFYWRKEADKFVGHYRADLPVWKRLVGSFLDARTDMLLSLVNTTNQTVMLDLGCGHGVHMKLFAPRVKHITGIDSSPHMVKQAKKELSVFPKRKWKVIQVDAHKLPLKNNSFDLVIALGLFDYVASPEKVLSECSRVLKNNGDLVFTIPKKPSLFGFLRTPWGNQLKKYLFHLPPIDNIASKEDLKELTNQTHFRINAISSLWTTMWIVKARKKR